MTDILPSTTKKKNIMEIHVMLNQQASHHPIPTL